MKRFGDNPYGEALFRVVFSDSRTDLIGGKWPDGICDYREARRYPFIHAWVLEKWQSPEEYAGTREYYERQQLDAPSGLFTCGPYPARGEYAYCYTFPFQPEDSMVVNAVTAIKLSGYITPGEQKQAIMGQYEKAQKAQDAQISDIVDDAIGGFAGADAVVSFAHNPWGRQGWKRGADIDLPREHRNIALPKMDNSFGVMGKNLVKELGGVTDANA